MSTERRYDPKSVEPKWQALWEAKTATHKRGRLPAGKHLFRKGF